MWRQSGAWERCDQVREESHECTCHVVWSKGRRYNIALVHSSVRMSRNSVPDLVVAGLLEVSVQRSAHSDEGTTYLRHERQMMFDSKNTRCSRVTSNTGAIPAQLIVFEAKSQPQPSK